MTLPAHKIERVRPDYLSMRLKYFSWLCQKPRAIGHVSDLIMCLRQRVFQQLDPRPPTYKQMNFYSSGGSIHSKNQEMQASDPGHYQAEYKLFYKGLSGSVDVYDKVENIPLEYKTPRKEGPLKEPQSYNVDQLKTYMSMLGSESGYLEYQFITNKAKDELIHNYQHFWIDMSHKEHKEQLEDMLSRLSNLKQGIEMEEPAVTDAVYDNPKLKWLCYSCPYLEPCQQMR
jgi:hypothetical protein